MKTKTKLKWKNN